jgi:hypothetical protein
MLVSLLCSSLRSLLFDPSWVHNPLSQCSSPNVRTQVYNSYTATAKNHSFVLFNTPQSPKVHTIVSGATRNMNCSKIYCQLRNVEHIIPKKSAHFRMRRRLRMPAECMKCGDVCLSLSPLITLSAKFVTNYHTWCFWNIKSHYALTMRHPSIRKSWH